MGYRPSVRSRWLDIESPRIIIIYWCMLSSAAKGRNVMKRKERSRFPHGHLVFFILLPSSSTIPLEITAGVAMVVHVHTFCFCGRASIMHKRSKGTRGCGTKRSQFPCGLHLWLRHWNNTKTHQLWKLHAPLKMPKDEMLKVCMYTNWIYTTTIVIDLY